MVNLEPGRAVISSTGSLREVLTHLLELWRTQMGARIDRRVDINPERGAQEYGDVEFADPVNN